MKMTGLSEIQKVLEEQLRGADLDLLDIIPLPSQADRMVKLRTIEEILEEFESSTDSGETMGYVVHVRPKRRASLPAHASGTGSGGAALTAATATTPATIAGSAASSGSHEGIYLPDGKLNVPYLSRNADLLFASGDYALAKNVYRAILASGEKTPQALFGIARCAEAEGLIEEAQAHYEESVAYQPSLESYRRLSNLLILRKKEHEAAEVLERALNIKELGQEIRFELHQAAGNCWTRARKLEPAERHFKACLALNPHSDEVRSNLGALHLQHGRTSDARRHFQDAVAANPRNDKALMGLGSCYVADGEKRLAHDFFAKALEANLNNPTAIFYLVKCAFEIKSYATAARLVEEYIEIAPVNVNLMYSLAGLQFHLGRTQEARATTQRILQLQPHHSGAQELAALMENRLNPGSR